MRWRLLTCSYPNHHPDLGVPVPTSVGRHPAYRTSPEVNGLKPFGVFRVLDHLPAEAQRAAYRQRLDRERERIERNLDDLTHAYRDTPLVLLCWCNLRATGPDGCHRRWAAGWFTDTYGLDVPEVGAT